MERGEGYGVGSVGEKERFSVVAVGKSLLEYFFSSSAFIV
jgi:hypothetical protein